VWIKYAVRPTTEPATRNKATNQGARPRICAWLPQSLVPFTLASKSASGARPCSSSTAAGWHRLGGTNSRFSSCPYAQDACRVHTAPDRTQRRPRASDGISRRCTLVRFAEQIAWRVPCIVRFCACTAQAQDPVRIWTKKDDPSARTNRGVPACPLLLRGTNLRFLSDDRLPKRLKPHRQRAELGCQSLLLHHRRRHSLEHERPGRCHPRSGPRLIFESHTRMKSPTVRAQRRPTPHLHQGDRPNSRTPVAALHRWRGSRSQLLRDAALQCAVHPPALLPCPNRK
jgi:hypothetical protein